MQELNQTENKQINQELNEYLTTISLKYCNNWGNWEAIREIAQNTLDELGTLPKIDKVGNDLIISDNGSGLSLKQLCLLGISEKNSNDARGQYGEGLKIALLIFVRSGHEVEIRSQNFFVKIDKVLQFGEYVLRYQYIENLEPFQGLSITVKNFNENIDFYDKFNTGQKSVIAFREQWGSMINNEKPTLYVKNIFVKYLDEDKALFSYDLSNVTLERDRNTPRMYDITYAMGTILSYVENKEIISQIFDLMRKNNTLESQIKYFFPKNRSLWNQVFHEKFGINATIANDTDIISKGKYHGFKTVVFPNSSFYAGLLESGIASTEASIIQKQTNRREKTVTALKNSELRTLESALNIIKESTTMTIPTIKIYTSSKNDNVMGWSNGSQIGISRKNLNDSGKLLTCLTEELVHHNFNVPDATAEFQQTFIEQMGKVVSHITQPIKTKAKNIAFNAKLIKQTLHIRNKTYFQYSVKFPMSVNSKIESKQCVNLIVEVA